LTVSSRKVPSGHRWAVRGELVPWVAFSWGACAFFPVGVGYLNLFLMLLALAVSPQIRQRLMALPQRSIFLPVLLMCLWTVLIAWVGDWYPDTPTRLFHVLRVALVLYLGLMLTGHEARLAIRGFLCASVLAAFVVALHHAVGLPDWIIWRSLLVSHGNSSSGNMLSMATASGLFVLFGVYGVSDKTARWISLAAALALALAVSFHAVSRNAQLLVLILMMTAVFYRFRTWRHAAIGIATVALVVSMFWVYSPNTQSRFVELAHNVQDAMSQANYGSSGGVRWRMYQEAFQGMVDHPVLGTGVGSWLPRWHAVWLTLADDVAPVYRDEYSEINNPHNDFLLAGMETGVIGMLILAWIFLLIIHRAWVRKTLAGGATAIMGVGMTVTALVNAPLRDAALGMTLLWLLSASISAEKGALDE
jgi:O-antigen ligase